MSGYIREFSRECWTEVMNRVIGAAVFLDEPTAENLHWHGGFLALMDAGAVAVKTLSPFEFAVEEHKKGVFVCACTATQLQTMREIIRNSNFTHCIIISTAGLDVVCAELSDGRDVTDVHHAKMLETMLSEWIGKKQSAVEVVHVPVFAISPSGLTFVTPPFASLYPTFQGHLLHDSGPADLYSLSDKERSNVRRLAGCLSSMLGAMNMKEDIFYMGTFSSILAGVLEYSPVCIARRKNCTKPASLIIVDGTLDLCGVTSHSSECLLDKMMTVLPRFPGHSTDVAVDMSPLCEANMISLTEDIQLSPGCLWHADDDSCVQTFEHLMHKSQKEVLFHLHNKLSALDVQRSPAQGVARITPQSIEKILVAAKGRYELIEPHVGLLQQALGVTQTLKSPQHAQLELMQGLERQALQNIATSRNSTSVLNQICHLIKTRKERNLSLERLLSLSVHVYSLAGHDITFSKAQQDNLAETLARAVSEERHTLLPSDAGDVLTPDKCNEIAAGIVRRLINAGQPRRILTKYGSVLKPSEAGSAIEYKGVLQQLIEDLVHPDRPDLPDLKHRNEGIKDLLRSGLNILISSASKKTRSKHPLDNPLVMLLVVGGVTAEECRRLHRAVITSGTDAHLLLGSTRLVQPIEVMRDVLQFTSIDECYQAISEGDAPKTAPKENTLVSGDKESHEPKDWFDLTSGEDAPKTTTSDADLASGVDTTRDQTNMRPGTVKDPHGSQKETLKVLPEARASLRPCSSASCHISFTVEAVSLGVTSLTHAKYRHSTPRI